MASRIVIAPFSAKLHTGQPNAKNPSLYWWQIAVKGLTDLGCEVIQIGGLGEPRIAGTSQHVINQPLRKIQELINGCDVWVSVDSFLSHLCWAYKLKPGVVVWSVSDPTIWGHDANTNIIKSRNYLRPLQYQDWGSQPYNEDAFVEPEVVVDACLEILKSADRTTFIPGSLQMEGQAAISAAS